jgi:hypothetical protein
VKAHAQNQGYLRDHRSTESEDWKGRSPRDEMLVTTHLEHARLGRLKPRLQVGILDLESLRFTK